MATPSDAAQPLAGLVAYLFARREAILHNWRSSCEADPALGKVSSLSREEFNNLLPVILDILEQRLLGQPPEADPALTAQAHGLHRWHKAHSLRETMQELNLLAQTLYGELSLFQQLFPQGDTASLGKVHQQVAQLFQETLDGSVQKYDELQQLQAANRANTLQKAVEQLSELSRQRVDLLRTSSHDLNSGFSVATMATQLLQLDGLTEAERTEYLGMLARNLSNVQTLLGGLMDLSRLESGQEQLQLESVEVSELLNELVTGYQPMALQQHLVLRADGPPQLTVSSDRVKLQRIAQNLITNALKYTPSSPDQPGIVSVSWSAEGEYHWVFSVQDSGPGLSSTVVGALADQLRPTVEPTAIMGPDESEPVSVLPDDVPTVPTGAALDQLSSQSSKGEGVGLQIVKRLCELLDANLDVETKPGRGTLFRVRLPMSRS